MSGLYATSKHYFVAVYRRYQKLHTHGKLFLLATACLYTTLACVVIFVGASRIGQILYDLAQDISHRPYGWLLLGGVIVFVSFPPCIGHTTLVTLCGYAYGMKGFLIAAGASVLGSAAAFVILRMLFSERLRRWSSSNEKWQALETVVASKGLPLIVLVRASPFPPWVYSNTLFASVEAVSLWQFVLATFVVFPKIALLVFVGSRLAPLSDGEQRSHMDTSTKILNASISIGGILVTIIAGWYVMWISTIVVRFRDILP
ncbi:Golgi apparatus membrane protein TVP38 [Laetiporus sulphureus 93-53]|uniref:Golgi apparatus membrane protein TVP38 n=1 Tax=Laetiporus sulphureus 93-53 TaxID=1314785 RepID=A0A165IAF6_9APHY|nr:Golgi apparatus membrane protein TVP38 [Laetiporus sulphureus 93-53]KZT12803.1 Golgi apparatus membrane protein TVP38 [Laetiporus sulphureus 93-53]